MPQEFSSRSCKQSIIATLKILCTEISNQRISYLKQGMKAQASKLLILDSPRYATPRTLVRLRGWRRKQEPLTTSHQRSWLEIMTSHATCGQLVASCIFCFAVIPLFTEMMINKFLKWFKRVNMISMAKSGKKWPKMQRIWSRSSLLNQKEGSQLKRLSNINGLKVGNKWQSQNHSRRGISNLLSTSWKIKRFSRQPLRQLQSKQAQMTLRTWEKHS